MQRREAIAGLATLSVVPLAGCLGGVDPEVVSTNQENTGSTYEIDALIRNNGDTGRVEVTLNLYDASGNTLDTQSKSVRIEEETQRRVQFIFDPPAGFDSWDLAADEAD